MQFLGVNLITDLLYRASEYGFKAEHFHYRCDNMLPTITLIKIKDGPCICGFTTAQWSSPDVFGTIAVPDPFSILFNLTNRRFFPCIHPPQALSVGKHNGPCFGRGDLCLSEPFNADGNGFSEGNTTIFGINTYTDKNGNMRNGLTDSLISHFNIEEIEVWEVAENVQTFVQKLLEDN